MIFISSLSNEFPFEEAEKLFIENQHYVAPHIKDFKQLCESLNGNLYAVMVDELIGVIYFDLKGSDWYLSGFSKRKKFKHIAEAITKMCDIHSMLWNTKTIYSKTPHKHAKLALLRAGFEHLSDYIYRKEL